MIDRLANTDRLLVVSQSPQLLRTVQQRFGQAEVVGCQSFLAAIAQAARQPVRAVLAGVESASWRLPQAVNALRKVRQDARIVLCCQPAFEPLVRQAGADDYLIYPPTGDELDQALQMPATDSAALLKPLPTVAPAIAAAELAGLSHILADLDEPLAQLLDRLAGLLQQAFDAQAVMIRTPGAAGQVGPAPSEPVLVEPIESDGETLGQIMLGKAPHGYRAAHAERLGQYAKLIASILTAAKAQRQWRQKALTDELTGLPNRRYLMQILPDLLARAGQNRFRITLLMFDLDNLKHYNDQFSHSVGDELIRETAQLFRRHCRKHDLVTRHGGDEFCVVFWDAEQPRVAGSKHPDNALEVLDRFRQALQQHEFPALGASGPGQLTISGGLASFPWDATEPDQLLEQADQALRQAKAAGKNRIYLVGGADTPDPSPPHQLTPPPESH